MSKITFGRLEDGTLLEFPAKMLRELQFLIVGATGQRKTLFLLSVLLQLLSINQALIFIDLGGDKAAYGILKRICQLLGKTLHLFSPNRYHASKYFDPLITGTGFTDPQIASNAVATGLNLVHSEGYGRSYYSRFNVAHVNAAFDGLALKGIDPPVFSDLTAELKTIAKSRRRGSDISEAVFAADQLTRVRHFGKAADPSQQMNIADVIEAGDVAYFYLPTALYGASARAVASLASWCVMVEMAQRDEANLPPRIVHLAIDEYAQVASGKNSLESTLVLSRKWGVQMWLVVQSREQTVTPDDDLWPVFRDNTQRFLFTVEGEEQQRELMNCSEDQVVQVKSVTQAGLGNSSIQLRDELRPKLERNKIIAVSGQAMQLFGVFNLGDHHRDPIPFTVIPPTASPEEHAALKAQSLPTKPPSPSEPDPKRPDLSPQRLARHIDLQALYEQIATESQIEHDPTG